MLVTLNRQVVSISHKEVSLYIFTRHRLKPGDSWEALVRWSPPGPVGSPAAAPRSAPAGLLREGQVLGAVPRPHSQALVTPGRRPHVVVTCVPQCGGSDRVTATAGRRVTVPRVLRRRSGKRNSLLNTECWTACDNGPVVGREGRGSQGSARRAEQVGGANWCLETSDHERELFLKEHNTYENVNFLTAL